MRRTLSVILVLAAVSTATADDVFGGREVRFLPDGAVVTFDAPMSLRRITLEMQTDAGNWRPVLTETLPDRPVLKHRLFFDPRETDYLFTVTPRGGEPFTLTARPSAEDLFPLTLLVEVPYTGEADITGRWGPPEPATLPLSKSFTASVQLMSWRKPTSGDLTIALGEGVSLDGDRDVLSRRERLVPMQVVQHTLRLKLTNPSAAGPLLTVSFTGETGLIERRVARPAHEARDVSDLVKVADVEMPASAWGERDIRKPRDTVVLPAKLTLALRRMLGAAEPFADYYAPVTWQTVVIGSDADVTLPVVVTMQVFEADSDVPAVAFSPPDYMGSEGKPFAVTARLAPGAETRVVMPVFLRADRALPGRYRARIEVRVLGADRVISAADREFVVRRADVRALVVTAAAVLVTVLGCVVFLARQRRIFRAFRVSELVLIALFASMTFVLVIFPGSVLGPVFTAVAGPFAFLVQGIFFQALRVLVLVALVVLVPKPGTVTLVSLVRYLIAGLIFGGFAPSDVFYLGASVVLLESALWAGGITSKHGILRGESRALASAVYVALIVGLVNAATQYVTYCLNISFYRLYFADWFILLAVVVNGFLYAFLGTLPGLRLGRRLKRISES